jgi:hypothetical protein
MGVPSLVSIFDKSYYTDLKGGVLEAFGKLFPTNIKLYVYPTFDINHEKVLTSKDVIPTDATRHLYAYLQESRCILDIKSNLSDQLRVKSFEVLKMIENGDKKWEKYVPMVVAKTIKEKQLFGYSK